MLYNYRQSFFTLFAVFYVITLPFLIILSLGYDFDVENQSLNNTLTLNIQTFPRGADVTIGENTFTSNVELRTQDDINFDVDISLDGYLDEKFSFFAPAQENSSARILNLRLLPAEPSLTEEKDSLEYLSILSENEILLQNQRGEYFVSNYSLAGLQGEPREVTGDLNRTIEKGWWTQLVDEIFWEEDKGVLLHRDIVSNTWEFIDLFALPQEFISIVRFSERGILLLDSDSNLWLMDLQTQELRFVDTGYSGLAYTDTPDSIWLWKQDSIYRLDRTSIDENIFQSELNPFVTDLELLQDGEVDLRSFMVKGDFLGVVFKVQNNLFYLPDASPGSWQHLSNNASFFTSHEGAVFWFTDNKQLIMYNILLRSIKNFGDFDFTPDNPEDIRMGYAPRWSRLFVYTENQVHSLWIDTEVINATIRRYYPKVWIDNSVCLPEVRDSYQFCIQDNQFIQYKNTSTAAF